MGRADLFLYPIIFEEVVHLRQEMPVLSVKK